ncbi:MAG: hypothetical protein WCE75_15220, partial [Terracidiphilus sp.]
HERLPLYHGKVPGEGGLNDEVRQALEEILAAEGIKATVVATPVADRKLHKNVAVSYAVTSPPVLVGAVEIAGVANEDRETVRKILARLNDAQFDSEGSPNQLETEVGNYYRDKGYAEVAVHAERAGAVQVAADAVRIGFALKVERGEQYRIGAVRLAPDLLVTQAEFDKAAHPEPGALATRANLFKGQMLVARRYKQKGYPEAKIDWEPVFDHAGGTVSYNVHAVAGDQYRLSTVKIEGLSDEVRRALLRAWQLAPDDPLDTVYISEFVPQAQKENPSLATALLPYHFDFQMILDPQTHTGAVVLRFKPRSGG